MTRVLALLFILSQFVIVNPAIAADQRLTDAETAARVAVELSALEASGDFNTLYDRIHPDARAEVPRSAAVGWFQNEFAPRGPGVATATGVRFVAWTWAVTGVTYQYTAEVSFVQPFADGTVTEDVVRLVQDHNGEWRWFFGRSREFVDEQIALYVPAAPVATRNQSILEAVADDIDMYWNMAFATAGEEYASPALVMMDDGAFSACGYLDGSVGPGAYCPADQTVYVSMEWFVLVNSSFGNFAWITILAHEWGHHVQSLSGYASASRMVHELQADCLSGSYALDANTRGLLQEGDIVAAVTISASSGDPVWMAEDHPGAHGTADERVSAFMRGYLDGFIGCDFAPTVARGTLSPSSGAVSLPVADLVNVLPSGALVPADLAHTGDSQRSLAEVVINYTDPMDAERLFRDWGWEENVTRSFDGAGTFSGITAIYASVHRFSSEENAALALDYSVEDQALSTGAWEIDATPIGTTTRVLATASDVTAYVQQGNVLVRLTVYPADQSTAEDIVRQMLVGLP